MVKRFFAKVISVFMTAVLTLGLVGCGGNKDAADNSTPKNTDGDSPKDTTEKKVDQVFDEEEIEQYTVLKDSDGNVYDLGGMEIIIRDWWSSGEEPEPNNAYEEARQEWLEWIQKTYNFKIKQLGMSDWEGTPEDFVNYATTGGDENYLFIVYQGSALVAAMNSGLIYDLSTLDCLDFSQDKWKSGVHKLLTGPNGEIYGMNASTPEPRAGVFFNKRLIQEAGYNPDDLYKWQEDGSWTWEKFVEVSDAVQRDIDNDGVIDIYGETSQRAQIYSAAVYSNGGEFVGKDANGKYVNKLETNETLEALNWAMDYIIKHELPVPADAAWDWYVSAFKEGKAAFCVDDGYRFNDFASMEDDWGFVCFPKGPNKSDYTNCYQDNVIVIPACYDAEKAWKLAFAYNLFTEPIKGFENYEGWKSGYYSKARDNESVDLTLARMVKNGIVTYHNMIPNLQLGADLLWSLGYADESGQVATPAQRAEAIRATWNSYIDAANK